MEQESIRIFSDNWSVYETLLRNNYMHHAEFARETAAVLKDFQKDLHMLDLGCGDTRPLLPALKEVAVASYTGYDLSQVMLQFAESELTTHGIPHILRHGNMCELIHTEEKKFDVVYSSFAIHHLQDREKRKLVQACFSRLSPGGKMIYIDTFRPRLVSHEEYMEGYLAYVTDHWQSLNENERELLCNHIRQYDFPSDIEITIEWLEYVGFLLENRYQPDQYHVMIVLKGE